MIKKTIVYHLLLFFVVLLFACAPRINNVAPKPTEKDNKFMAQLLRNIITQGLDF
ncbi:MAG: hypothetical protein H8E55_69720 [Pelagibacterales bacterium]|nr:hypothetical protein [Pelagibacterales bacterium]